jgi:hypothetical protein
MDESSLRWRARIGALRGLGMLGLVIFGILLLIVGVSLITALRNPRNPQPVTIQQLVDGSIDMNKYVTLDGYALYEEGYEETENGSVVASYYLMLDDISGYLVLVQASSNNFDNRVSDFITLSGMTSRTETDLQNLVQSDSTYYAEAGFITSPYIYIREGDKPGDPGVQAFIAVLLAGGILFSIVPFFFPATVFLPKPVDATATAIPTKKKGEGIKATGRFLKMKKMEPTIVPGKNWQKYTETVANIISLEGERLMVYIHHVVRYNFIPISKTHWGIFLTPRNARDIQQGVKLGWNDRPAVEITYPSKDGQL